MKIIFTSHPPTKKGNFFGLQKSQFIIPFLCMHLKCGLPLNWKLRSDANNLGKSLAYIDWGFPAIK